MKRLHWFLKINIVMVCLFTITITILEDLFILIALLVIAGIYFILCEILTFKYKLRGDTKGQNRAKKRAWSALLLIINSLYTYLFVYAMLANNYNYDTNAEITTESYSFIQTSSIDSIPILIKNRMGTTKSLRPVDSVIKSNFVHPDSTFFVLIGSPINDDTRVQIINYNTSDGKYNSLSITLFECIDDEVQISNAEVFLKEDIFLMIMGAMDISKEAMSKKVGELPEN